MARVGYLDCFSGLSGDMLLGAIVDAGVAVEALEAELQSIPADGWSLRAERTTRGGHAATLVRVELAEQPHPHRRLAQVLEIVQDSALPAADRASASLVFQRLAEAEAQVHGVTPGDIDFHEVGALDAIIDVCGAVAGLRLLGIERLYCSPLPAGSGTARAQHGNIPVPAPATLALMALAGAPLAASTADRPMEMTTPTGAAIVTSLATFERPQMRLERIGAGAGGRDPEGWPNIARLWVGQEVTAQPAMFLVETNIDDMSPEILGYVQERLFAEGAADVWFQPIQMKKNRPGILVSVICASDREPAVANILLSETSTLGVRVSEIRRHEAEREIVEFESSLGRAAVKVKRLPGEAPRIAPEYEVCRQLALANEMPLIEVYRIVEREAADHLASMD